MAQEMREAAAGGGPDEQQLANEMADAFLSDILPENIFSSPKAGAGMCHLTCYKVKPHSLGKSGKCIKHTVSNRLWQYQISTLIPDDLNIGHLILVRETLLPIAYLLSVCKKDN